MKSILIGILTSYYTWIAIELILIAVLVFFVRRYSRKKKAAQRELAKQTQAVQYRELDEKLENKRRSGR